MSNIYRIFLEEILVTIKKIKKLLDGVTYEKFKNCDRLVDNIIRYLTIIGEASKHIPEEVRKEYHDIPWKSLADLRNIFNHSERIEKIWYIATVELMKVKTNLKTSLK